jgi:hypothetical protein
VLALLAGWQGTRAFVRTRAARWSLVALVPTAIFAVLWIVLAHSLDLLPVGVVVTPGESRTHLVLSILGNTYAWLQQMVGTFGWLDTLAPLATYYVWYAVLGLVLLVAFSVARRRQSSVLALIIAIVILAPVAISYQQAHRIGVIWQARYIMPVAVAVPLLGFVLCTRVLDLPDLRRRLPSVIAVLVAIAQWSAFAGTLRRYAVGLAGPLDFLNGAWRPPLGDVILLVGDILASVLLAGLVRALLQAGPDSQTEVGAPAVVG